MSLMMLSRVAERVYWMARYLERLLLGQRAADDPGPRLDLDSLWPAGVEQRSGGGGGS